MSFDRVADIYDSTRGFPPGVPEQAAQLIVNVGDLTAEMRVFELGIGTGRIGLPIAKHLNAYYGADISSAMMARLSAKQSAVRVLLAQADAAMLPYRSNAFDAVVVVHVFHLVPDVARTLAELKRVMRPEAKLIHCWNTNDSTLHEARRLANEAMGVTAQNRSARWDRIKTELSEAGWTAINRSDDISYTTTDEPRTILDRMAHRTWSSTWEIEEQLLQRGIEAMRGYFQDRAIDLDQAIEVKNVFKAVVYMPPS